MRKNDKRSLPPSGRDRIISTRIMRKLEPERRSTKSFAQDRGSTGFLRMVLRAHNVSARTIGRERKRILRRENLIKMRTEGVFEGERRQKQRSKGSSRSPYCLLGSKVKRSTAVCGAANQAEQRARVELRTSFETLGQKPQRRQERVFGYVPRSTTTSRMRSERENGAYFSKHARRRGKKRCTRESPK